MIVPVILCGGSGTRLWPVSRRLYPKQFHNLRGQGTLLQQTARRAARVAEHSPIIVVTNDAQKFLVTDQLKENSRVHVVIEPLARNTAPAIALAALYATTSLSHIDTRPELLVMPSDHLISDDDAFARIVGTAERLAGAGKLVTFGVSPTGAETGYGYIERGDPIDTGSNSGGFEVAEFLEKPDTDTARQLWQSGDHLWNSGIFVFDANVYLEELAKHSTAVHSASVAAFSGLRRDGSFLTMPADEFEGCPNISVDYAVMERTDKAAVVAFEGNWSDIGSWQGLWETMQSSDPDPDPTETVTVGDVYARDVAGSYLHSSSRLVSAVGIEDMIVVETADAVLVTKKGEDQKVKELVEDLRRAGRYETEHHTQVYRPWGSYQSLEQDDHFQVKRLIIKPGASISLQLHHRRAEHWVVVKGEAVVTRGEQKFVLGPNQSTYIPKETIHKLENHTEQDLEIIEVQTGEYFGEDDIERFEDQYGRT